MKGIVLAGGTGSRLYPLTRITNKHLLPVYDRPMIYHAIELLAAAGIGQIMVVVGGNHAGEFLPLLGNGSQFGLKHLDYTFQEKPAGIADALGLAEHFVSGDRVCVLLGDNIFEYGISGAVQRFEAQQSGARLLLRTVENAANYGVGRFENGRLVRIEEKPRIPPSSLAVTGCYFYDQNVFGMIRDIHPSARGELEITDVNNLYLSRGDLEYEEIRGYWADCGESLASYFRSQQLVAENGANKPA